MPTVLPAAVVAGVLGLAFLVRWLRKESARQYSRLRIPWAPSRLVFTVDGILSRSECAALVARAEAAGFSPSPMRPLQMGLRSRFDDSPLAARLFERLRPYLPPVWRRCELHALTPTFRFIRYAPGDGVAPHPDTSGGDRHTPVAEPNFSFFTCLINLNDGYEGCETHMLPPESNVRLDLWPGICAERGVRVVPW